MRRMCSPAVAVATSNATSAEHVAGEVPLEVAPAEPVNPNGRGQALGQRSGRMVVDQVGTDPGT